MTSFGKQRDKATNSVCIYLF